jgi:hypothetical protein
MRLRSLLVPVLFGLALLAIALVTRTGILARKNPGLPISTGMREALGQMDLPLADRELVQQRYPDATVTASGLRYIVLQPGEGETPKRGHYLAVHYREQLLDGTVTDDSRARGEGPFNFQLGQGRAMPAWEEALPTMKKGEKRLLIVPYWLGYGEKGSRGRVPRQATLVIELELVDLR